MEHQVAIACTKTLVLPSEVQPPFLLYTNHIFFLQMRPMGLLEHTANHGDASHRAVHKYVPAKLDVEYHQLMRILVGPPASTQWESPWHHIALHQTIIWRACRHGLKVWPSSYMHTSSSLPTVDPKTLEWNIDGPRGRGRPVHTCEKGFIPHVERP